MGLGTVIFSIPAVQTQVARYATSSLNKAFGTHISIDKVRLSLFTLRTNIQGVYIEDHQQDTLLYVRSLRTSLLNLKEVAQGKLTFGAMALKGVFFHTKTYRGATQSNLEVFVEQLDDGTPRPPETPPFFMSSSEIHIAEGSFRLTDENLERPEVLNFTDVMLQAKDFQISGPEVSLHLEDLSLDTQRGIALQHLSTRFAYTPQQMRFEELQLRTRESDIAGNLALHYKPGDLAAFVDRVTLEGTFTKSRVALNDINTFYKAFGKDKVVLFSGKVSGTLNRLRVKDLAISSESTQAYGDFAFTHLFSDRHPFAIRGDIASLTTSYYQLCALLPRLLGKNLPAALQRLGQFTIQGQAEVTEASLKTRITINTALGQGHTDLQITQLQNLEEAQYVGVLSLTDFDVGTLAHNRLLGRTALEVHITGKGFRAEDLNTTVKGEVRQLEYNRYNYKDLKVSGVFKDRFFEGSLESEDENLRFSFEGLADFGVRKNTFNFKASVAHADLRRLHFTNDSISVFKGDVLLNIQGTTLDNVAGYARFSNATYRNQNDTYYFEDLVMASSFNADRVRTIQVNSPDVVTGYLKGKFNTNEIGKLVQNALGSLYTHYKPFDLSEGQYLDFNFNINNKIVGLFLPQVTLGANTFIQGTINADRGDFTLSFTAPRIEAFGNTLTAVDLKVDNKNPGSNATMTVGSVVTDYYTVKDFSLLNTAQRDTLFFQTSFRGGEEDNDRYALNFYHTLTEDRQSVIGLKKSELTFKGNTWLLNKNDNAQNKILLNKTRDSITIEELVMDHNQGEQIRLKGQLADSTYKNINLQFSRVSLSKITPSIDSLQLNGSAEGVFKLLQKNGKYLPTSSLQIADFKINNQRLGDLDVGIFGNNDLTRFTVNTRLSDQGEEKMSINGHIVNRNRNQELDLSVAFANFSLKPFSSLGGDVITNLRGTVSGSAKIRGALANPSLSGNLSLYNAGLAIPYLNVDYNFAPRSRIRLSNQTFFFDNINLSDKVHGTTAILDGTISHNHFTKWSLDLKVDTRNNRFMILNAPYSEETLYYGTAFINGTGRIYGPTHALTITVDATTAKGTALKIPLRDVTSVGDYTFINFIEKGTAPALEEERVLKEYQGLEMAFDLAVTPDAEVEVVIDQDSGSSLKGTGEGILLIEINTNGKFNMYGDFVVVTGSYNLKYGKVIDKTFKVRPGGQIIWDRDPLKAQLDLEAFYALNANPAPLLDNPGFTGRIPTEVVVHLEGGLESPNIYFDIDFPGTSSVVQSELAYRLQDPTIKERNAFSLLAQGAFWNQQTTPDGGQIALGNAIQTASGLLNQILDTNTDKFNLGVSYEQGVLDPDTDTRTENRIGVTVSTQLSDRILVNGRVGVPVGGVSESAVAGDVEVQILLNEKGTLSAKIFNRENQIQQFLAERQGYIQGVGLAYQVDFGTFRELLQKILTPQKNNAKL